MTIGKIKHSDVPGLVHEHETHRFSAFASDLGKRAGEPWPQAIATELGNGQPFLAVARKVRDGDLLYVRYAQACGCIDLTIYND